MKYTFRKVALTIGVALAIYGCQKAPLPQEGAYTSEAGQYSSVNDFLQKNAPPVQSYTVHGGTGGSFTTPQGTVVTIPGNAFTDKYGNTIFTDITIQFLDIYKKSDMLLCNMPTAYKNTYPMKSGGEFYIKALSGSQTLQFNGISPITVQQPLNGVPYDASMNPFDYTLNTGWIKDNISGIKTDSITNNYIFNLYKFHPSADSGTWCNSDDSTYFLHYPMTKVVMNPMDDPTLFGTSVFLIFKGINCAVHVYIDSTGKNFPYLYAPMGLQCTVVALGNCNGNPYSSFVPISIGANQIVNFSLSITTPNDFMSQVEALN